MTLSELFETFQISAFRLEGRSNYSVVEEKDALEFYDSTGQLPENYGNEWFEFVKNQTQLGKKMQRLRLLSNPLSKYERFELNAYIGVKGGEDIRFAKRSNQPYESDFWLFDNKWLARMEYGDDGSYIKSTVSEVTGEDCQGIDDWLALYCASPSISEITSISK